MNNDSYMPSALPEIPRLTESALGDFYNHPDCTVRQRGGRLDLVPSRYLAIHGVVCLLFGLFPAVAMCFFDLQTRWPFKFLPPEFLWMLPFLGGFVALLSWCFQAVVSNRSWQGTFDRDGNLITLHRKGPPPERFETPLANLASVLVRLEAVVVTPGHPRTVWHVYAVWLRFRGGGFRLLLTVGYGHIALPRAARRIAAAIARYAGVPLEEDLELP
jgi:hypothetical protein